MLNNYFFLNIFFAGLIFCSSIVEAQETDSEQPSTQGFAVNGKVVDDLYQLDRRNQAPDEFDFSIGTNHSCSGGLFYRVRAGSVDIANRQFNMALASVQTGQTIDFWNTGTCDGNRAIVSWMRLNGNSTRPICEGEGNLPVQFVQRQLSSNTDDIILGGVNPLNVEISFDGFERENDQYDFFLNLRNPDGTTELKPGQNIFMQGPISSSTQYSVSFPNTVGSLNQQTTVCATGASSRPTACGLIEKPGSYKYLIRLNQGEATIQSIMIVGSNRPLCTN